MRVYYAHFLCPSSLLLTRCFKAFSIYFCTARMQAGQGSGLPSSVAVNNYTLLSSYPSQLINHTYTNKIFVMVYGFLQDFFYTKKLAVPSIHGVGTSATIICTI